MFKVGDRIVCIDETYVRSYHMEYTDKVCKVVRVGTERGRDPKELLMYTDLYPKAMCAKRFRLADKTTDDLKNMTFDQLIQHVAKRMGEV